MPITRDIKMEVRQGLDEKRIARCLIMLAELLEDLERRLRTMGQITVDCHGAMKEVLVAVGMTSQMLDVVGDNLSPEVTAKLKRVKDGNVSVGSESLPAPESPLIGGQSS